MDHDRSKWLRTGPIGTEGSSRVQDATILREERGDLFEHLPVAGLLLGQRRRRRILWQIKGEAADKPTIWSVQLHGRSNRRVSGQGRRLPEPECAIGDRLRFGIERNGHEGDEVIETVDLVATVLHLLLQGLPLTAHFRRIQRLDQLRLRLSGQMDDGRVERECRRDERQREQRQSKCL